MTVTTPMMPMPITTTMVPMPTATMMVVMPMPMPMPMPVGRGDLGAKQLGVPLRGRAFRSNLRFAPISTAIPDASAPFGRCALRLPGGSLRSPPLPGRRARHILQRHRSPDRRVLLAPALRAGLVAVLASLALAGCAGCGHRSGSSRQHSVRYPVPASPRTGSRTARCTRARTPAERDRTSLRTAPGSSARMTAGTATASGSVLRTTAHGSGRTARRSIAAAAPTGEGRRRRFPELRCCRFGCPARPGRLCFHTPRIDDALPASARRRMNWRKHP